MPPRTIRLRGRRERRPRPRLAPLRWHSRMLTRSGVAVSETTALLVTAGSSRTLRPPPSTRPSHSGHSSAAAQTSSRSSPSALHELRRAQLSRPSGPARYGRGTPTGFQRSRSPPMGQVRRATPAPGPIAETQTIVPGAPYVERLAYTRSQAAEALGVSRSTFIRRVLPYVETIEMPWGAKLIPVDELERVVAERRRVAQARPEPTPPGRPPAVPQEVVLRIQGEHAAGTSLRQIAAALNQHGVATGHGGVRWWPSTVRSVLERSTPSTSARDGGK